MNHRALVDGLDRFATVLPAVVAGIAPDDSRWRPPSGAWSILEIVRHLVDEESLDFRRRVELTLGGTGETWPPIDPEGWATERRYNEGSLDDAVAAFVAARGESVSWLRGLADPAWTGKRRSGCTPSRS